MKLVFHDTIFCFYPIKRSLIQIFFSPVRDCEAIRHVVLGHKERSEDQKWTLLGQSFGGFCIITYLSFFSQGIKEVFVTGGLAPLVDDPDAVYAAIIREWVDLILYLIEARHFSPLPLFFSAYVVKRNEIYYAKYPKDVKRVR